MSEFEKVRERVLAERSSSLAQKETWLEIGEEVEALLTDSEGEPYLETGQFAGVAVPDGGGPVRFVLRGEGGVASIDPNDLVGMTKAADSQQRRR